MSDSIQQMLAHALDRTERFVKAVDHLERADRLLLEVGESLRTVEHAGEAQLGVEAHALQALASAARARMAERAHAVVRQYGWQVATYLIAPEAKKSGDEAIVWITPNAMFPPLRWYGASEIIWQLDNELPGIWEAYVEGIENRLDELHVLMTAPEYDNSLYVVDLERFEWIPEEELDADDDTAWRPITKD